MAERRDSRVDDYIATLPDWQGKLAERVRAFVHAADEDVATARAIRFREGDVVNEPALVQLFGAVIANNRAGGWRKQVSG